MFFSHQQKWALALFSRFSASAPRIAKNGIANREKEKTCENSLHPKLMLFRWSNAVRSTLPLSLDSKDTVTRKKSACPSLVGRSNPGPICRRCRPVPASHRPPLQPRYCSQVGTIYVQMITLVVLHYGYILLCILASATNNVKKVAWMVALVITYVYVPAFPVDYTIQKHFFEKEN